MSTHNIYLQKAQDILNEVELSDENRQFLLMEALKQALSFQMGIDAKARMRASQMRQMEEELEIKARIKIETAKKIKEAELSVHEYVDTQEELLDEIERLTRENTTMKSQLMALGKMI